MRESYVFGTTKEAEVLLGNTTVTVRSMRHLQTGEMHYWANAGKGEGWIRIDRPATCQPCKRNGCHRPPEDL